MLCEIWNCYGLFCWIVLMLNIGFFVEIWVLCICRVEMGCCRVCEVVFFCVLWYCYCCKILLCIWLIVCCKILFGLVLFVRVFGVWGEWGVECESGCVCCVFWWCVLCVGCVKIGWWWICCCYCCCRVVWCVVMSCENLYFSFWFVGFGCCCCYCYLCLWYLCVLIRVWLWWYFVNFYVILIIKSFFFL